MIHSIFRFFFVGLGERQNKICLPVIRMGERGYCRALLWIGRSLSLPVLTILPILPLALSLVALSANYSFAQKAGSADLQPQSAFEQSEADAIAFVQEHHPELVSLLQSLKSMRQREYEMAIREIVRTKKRLETLAKRETDLHGMELDAWKLKSKIDLLMAKAIARDKSFDKVVLRELLSQQVENQKKRWMHEQSTITKRQEQLVELLKRTEGHEDERVEQQLAAHLKNVDSKVGKAKKLKQEAKNFKEEKDKP